MSEIHQWVGHLHRSGLTVQLWRKPHPRFSFTSLTHKRSSIMYLALHVGLGTLLLNIKVQKDLFLWFKRIVVDLPHVILVSVVVFSHLLLNNFIICPLANLHMVLVLWSRTRNFKIKLPRNPNFSHSTVAQPRERERQTASQLKRQGSILSYSLCEVFSLCLWRFPHRA